MLYCKFAPRGPAGRADYIEQHNGQFYTLCRYIYIYM